MWRFASAIRDNNALMLKETLHDIDLLIIDDMQFLQGKKIQSEFCHLINTLLDSARQVVVAADRPPHELESLDARVITQIQLHDLERDLSVGRDLLRFINHAHAALSKL